MARYGRRVGMKRTPCPSIDAKESQREGAKRTWPEFGIKWKKSFKSIRYKGFVEFSWLHEIMYGF
jgi:hypothetical protein